MATIQKTTKELKVGDTLEVWWSPRRDTIISLKPYFGPHLELLGKGTLIAEFAILKCGMTCPEGDIFDVIVPDPTIQDLCDPAYHSNK